MPVIGILSFVIAVILAVLAYYFVFPKLNVEYEYIILNHDLQIDAIYNKSKRKRLKNLDIQSAEIIAPKGSPRLHSYKPDKVYDYSSGNPSGKAYAIMMPMDQNKCLPLYRARCEDDRSYETVDGDEDVSGLNSCLFQRLCNIPGRKYQIDQRTRKKDGTASPCRPALPQDLNGCNGERICSFIGTRISFLLTSRTNAFRNAPALTHGSRSSVFFAGSSDR